MYVAAMRCAVGDGEERRRRYRGTVGERIGSRLDREEVSVVEAEEFAKRMAESALSASLEMVTGKAKRLLSDAKDANAWCSSADAVYEKVRLEYWSFLEGWRWLVGWPAYLISRTA